MAENKTAPTDQNVEDFILTVEDEKKRDDSFELIKIMKEITGENPVMWGPSIIGFGSYHYKYATGREGDMCMIGFSPRKANFTVYIMNGFDSYHEQLAKLGKHKTSVSCLYIKRLSDIDREVLKEIIRDSVKFMKKTYG